MAILSLKKAKQLAAEKPIENLIGKYAVMRHARHERSIRFSVVHETSELAFAEASRLHKFAPTERFLVVSILGGEE